MKELDSRRLASIMYKYSLYCASTLINQILENAITEAFEEIRAEAYAEGRADEREKLKENR